MSRWTLNRDLTGLTVNPLTERKIMWCLLKLLGSFALLTMLSGCALRVSGSGNGTLHMKYDGATRQCEIDVAYRDQHYRQVFRDASHQSDYHQNLAITIPKYILVDGKTRQVGYFIFGGCKANNSDDDPDAKIEYVYLGFDLPSRSLILDGQNEINGLLPEELVRRGFSVTIPIDPDGVPVSSLPGVLMDNLIRQDANLIQLETSAGEVAGIRQKDVFCSSNSIWILGGTLTVPPGIGTPTDLAINSKPSSLRSYEVTIDQWEFDGVISGYSC